MAARPAWGRPEPPPPLVRPARQADPGRGGARRRLVGRRGGRRRGARGVGRDARSRDATRAVRAASARTCRSSSSAARRSSRVAGSASRRSPWLRDADAAHDRPGLLLVTPAVAISTPAAFRAWDDGARVGGGAARLASAHLAEELRDAGSASPTCSPGRPCSPARTTSRPPRPPWSPRLVPFKRALLRLLGRPVGLSGSGPSHWALYPSHDRGRRRRRDAPRRRRDRGAAHPGRRGPVRRRHPHPRHDADTKRDA